MADDWWPKHRFRYNIALIFAGLLAFACIAIVGECCPALEIEVTAFTLGFQLIGYITMIAVANICYQLGPWIEQFLVPKDLGRYRRIAFDLGLSFSVLLPLSIPAFLAISCVFGKHVPKIYL
jgi:hypothetical protein